MKHTKFIQALRPLSFAACAGLSLALYAQAPQFEVTVLIPQNDSSYYLLNALNNKGESVGDWYNGSSGGWLVYPNATIQNLPGFAPANCQDQELGVLLYDLNNNGTQMVGGCGDVAMHYVLYGPSSGDPIILSGNYSFAYAINNAGQIVGESDVASLVVHPVVFLGDETIIDLGGFGSPSYYGAATDINDRYGSDGFGQIVGSSELSMPPYFNQAFLYENGLMLNIGQVVCPYQDSGAAAINNKGEIAGSCCIHKSDGSIYNCDGFIYGSDTGTYAIFPGLDLYSINDDGWAIGNKDLYTENEVGYLVVDGIMYNLVDLVLPTFGVTSVQVIDMNDFGQILANTNLGTVLLTPIR